MRSAIMLVLTLVLLCIESVAVKVFGFSVTRIDVTLVLVVFLGLRANTVEGAFTAFSIGYLLDVFTGRPTGLYPFLAVLVFLLVRLLSSFVDARARGLFSAMAGAATFGHALLAVFFSWLTSLSGGGTVATLSGVPLQLGLSLVTAFLLWPVLLKLDPGQERPQAGVLL
jgi:cell shape-determining protein MreD